MHTTIKSGFPCIARVTYFNAGHSARTCAEVDDCYPAEAPELEFDLFTTRGTKAPWMKKMMTDADYLRISRQLLEKTH